MTDDIVDRLDASYEFLRDPLHLEARDEIERLRAALLDIIQKDALTGETVFVGDFGKIARAALAGGKSND